MNIIKAQNLACPIDAGPLQGNEKQLLCSQGHTFDIARQGYVNLLPVQHKRSRQPGDSKAMVVARQQFLNSGVYQPIASKLADIVFTQVVNKANSCLLDAGCGEGYYFNYVYQYLRDAPGNNNVSFIGLDISKPAIVEAAKRNREISWIVGTNRQPPVADASVDCIVCVFGFHSFDGFMKVLRPGGHIILVEPGADHLKELREVIYTEVKKTPLADLSGLQQKGLSVVDTQPLQFSSGMLDNALINQLLLMTPHFYRASEAGRQAAAKLQQLALTVDVVFRILQKS